VCSWHDEGKFLVHSLFYPSSSFIVLKVPLPILISQAVGQVLTVGLKLSSSETELAKAKTGLARNVAHAKTIAGLKTERDDLRGQVKKLKTEVVENDNLLLLSEESCKAFSDQVKALWEEMKNVGLVAVSKFKSSDEFQDVTRRYYADGFEHFRKRVFLAFGNVQDWSLVKMFDNDDETTMVEGEEDDDEDEDISSKEATFVPKDVPIAP
jgi:hypothetical protein